jgi:hypothetical protein
MTSFNFLLSCTWIIFSMPVGECLSLELIFLWKNNWKVNYYQWRAVIYIFKILLTLIIKNRIILIIIVKKSLSRKYTFACYIIHTYHLRNVHNTNLSVKECKFNVHITEIHLVIHFLWKLMLLSRLRPGKNIHKK